MIGWLQKKLQNWFEVESPLIAEQRQWIEERFQWLQREFGEAPVRRPIITPTEEFFPDAYNGKLEDVEKMLDRICDYMEVSRDRLELKLYESPHADVVVTSFHPELQQGYALGAFQDDGQKILIWLEQTNLGEPLSVVSTLSHELGHVHLLADGHCDTSTPDHEPLTDLLSVYFGFGIFRANSALHEVNWRSGQWSGWSLSKTGYLSMAEYAYALAIYAHTRGERSPIWKQHLRADVRTMFEMELRKLSERGFTSNAASEVSARAAVSANTSYASSTDDSDDLADREQTVADSDRTEETEIDTTESRDESDLETNTADELFSLGCACAAENDFDEAVDAFSQSLELRQDDAEVWLSRAAAYRALAHHAHVIEDCSQAILHDPDLVLAFCFRGEALLWLRRFPEALEDLEIACEMDGKMAIARLCCGLAYFHIGEFQQAINQLTQAIHLAPTWANNYLARSRAYEAMAQEARAAKDLAEAIRREPKFAETTYRETSLVGQT